VTGPSGPQPGPGLLALLREDVETHERFLTRPGLHALVVYRIGAWAADQPPWLRYPVGLLYRLVNTLLIRNVYGTEIGRTTVIGRRVKLGHHQGVVLGYSTVIGDDCLIRQGVTLGQSNDEGRGDDQPVVGNGVEFGAGATVIGRVRIGDGARIGPNALVTRNVPAGAVAFAPPARIIAPPSQD